MNTPEDVIDVQFETVVPKDQRADEPVNTHQKRVPAHEIIDDEQLAVFGKKPNAAKNKSMPLPVFALVAAVSAMTAFLLAGGHSLITFSQPAMPIAASPATEPAITDNSVLIIENVSTQFIARGNSNAVSIEATIFNKTENEQIIPPVIVSIGNPNENERRFTIGRGETLQQGERLVFTNTLRTGDVPRGPVTLSFSE